MKKLIVSVIGTFLVLSVFGVMASSSCCNSSSGDYDRYTPNVSGDAENAEVSGSATREEPTVQTTEAVVFEEMNPDIPLGTTYDLGQGNYEVGVDIPAGRYRIEYLSGNQFGGSMEGAVGDYVDDWISLDPDQFYTCILENGSTFSISLITARFTKVSSIPNSDYLQDDGSYVLGSGYYFEGIDFPCGRYDITAISGNQFGIDISTVNDSFIPLDIGETFSNLSFDHEGGIVEVSLGSIRLDPK